MSLFDFIRLIYRNLNWLVFISLGLGITVFVLTVNQPKAYGVSALIYTGIASGYNIESGEGDKIDYHSVNNAFDNLIALVKSQQTYEEVGLRLLAQHLVLEQPDAKIVNQAHFELLRDLFDTRSIDSYRVQGNVDTTFLILMEKYLANDRLLVEILRGGNAPYSVKKLNSIEVKRHKSSDMLSLYFSSNDPGITQQTLLIFIEVFSRRYKEIKDGETGDVVAYFERELLKAKNNLNGAEDKLTSFRVESRVINYGEQTKAIAIKKQNALEEFANKNMNLQATTAAVTAIEERLKVREDILAKNADLLTKKKKLEALTTQLALIESSGEDSLIHAYAQEQQRIKSAIEQDLSTLYNFSNSKEGLPSKQLLNDWLNNVIQLNREKVNVNLYQKRLEDIDQMYDHFAPLGSTIARLEREINVFEQTYLQILHGLNMAKLRQQNIEMMSNLKVIDWPRYPHEPKPSKRKILLALAVLTGLFGTLSVLVAGELLDGSLKKPEKATKLTGLEVASAFPVIHDSAIANNSSVLPAIGRLLAGKLSITAQKATDSQPQIITMMSVLPGQGKTTIGRILFEQMNLSGGQVAWVIPKSDQIESADHVFTYDALPSIAAIDSIQSLIPDMNLSNYRCVILELPAYNSGMVPLQIVKSSHLSLVVNLASKSWQVVHQTMVNDISRISDRQPMLVLNAVRSYHLDQILGEVRDKRNAIIQWFRSLARLEFTTTGFRLF